MRIDSGDLGLLAHRVRAQLDELGAPDTRIIVTSDLDEFAIAGPRRRAGRRVRRRHLAGHRQRPPDLAASSTSWWPARTTTGEIVGVAKKSKDKISVGGRKYALRRLSPDGVAQAEVVGIGQPAENDGDDRALLVPLVSDGEVVGREPLETARERHLRSRAELPLMARSAVQGRAGDRDSCSRATS